MRLMKSAFTSRKSGTKAITTRVNRELRVKRMMTENATYKVFETIFGRNWEKIYCRICTSSEIRDIT